MVQTQDHHITASGGRLFAREWRPAAAETTVPLVLLHDSLGCVDLWRTFPADLAQATGRRVVAYDRLGFGRSDPHPHHLALDFIATEVATDTATVLAALGIDDVVLCGHSVGGGMALCGAVALGSRCRAVVTQAAQTFAEDVTLTGVHTAKRIFTPGTPFFDRLQGYHGDKAAWVVSAWTESWLAPAFADWSLEGTLGKISCPVLALHGDKDEYGTRAHPDLIARAVKGPVEIELMTRCGHVPYREYPEQVVARIAAFLARTDA